MTPQNKDRLYVLLMVVALNIFAYSLFTYSLNCYNEKIELLRDQNRPR
jgi:hypothetical protein